MPLELRWLDLIDITITKAASVGAAPQDVTAMLQFD